MRIDPLDFRDEPTHRDRLIRIEFRCKGVVRRRRRHGQPQTQSDTEYREFHSHRNRPPALRRIAVLALSGRLRQRGSSFTGGRVLPGLSMLCSSAFKPSAHAYSYNSVVCMPSCWALVKPPANVHGFVNSLGSSMVTTYSIVFASTGVKRSTVCKASLWMVPTMSYQVRPVKFVVSTTSVVPSQRPTESPM